MMHNSISVARFEWRLRAGHARPGTFVSIREHNGRKLLQTTVIRMRLIIFQPAVSAGVALRVGSVPICNIKRTGVVSKSRAFHQRDERSPAPALRPGRTLAPLEKMAALRFTAAANELYSALV